MTKYCC